MSDTIKQTFTLTDDSLEDLFSVFIKKIPRYLEVLLFGFFILWGSYSLVSFICLINGIYLNEYFGIPEKIESRLMGYGLPFSSFFFIYYSRRNEVPRNKFRSLYKMREYELELDFAKHVLTLETLSCGVINQSATFPFLLMTAARQSNQFILLQQKTVTYPEWIFLKKDAITHADFQRLQEAIPCLQGLSVDPQQFKQESPTHES